MKHSIPTIVLYHIIFHRHTHSKKFLYIVTYSDLIHIRMDNEDKIADWMITIMAMKININAWASKNRWSIFVTFFGLYVRMCVFFSRFGKSLSAFRYEIRWIKISRVRLHIICLKDKEEQCLFYCYCAEDSTCSPISTENVVKRYNFIFIFIISRKSQFYRIKDQERVIIDDLV